MASNPLKIGIVMDPIGSITPYKDSSLAMLLEAERRGAEIHYLEQKDVSLLSGKALGQSTLLRVRDDNDDWYTLGDRQDIALGDLDAILMRKDPPFNMEYVYTTYILDRAKEDGALIVNAPQALRDMNEKAYTAWFPELTPVTLITRSMDEMKAFLIEHEHVVAKPLDGMGADMANLRRPNLSLWMQSLWRMQPRILPSSKMILRSWRLRNLNHH